MEGLAAVFSGITGDLLKTPEPLPRKEPDNSLIIVTVAGTLILLAAIASAVAIYTQK